MEGAGGRNPKSEEGGTQVHPPMRGFFGSQYLAFLPEMWHGITFVPVFWGQQGLGWQPPAWPQAARAKHPETQREEGSREKRPSGRFVPDNFPEKTPLGVFFFVFFVFFCIFFCNFCIFLYFFRNLERPFWETTPSGGNISRAVW